MAIEGGVALAALFAYNWEVIRKGDSMVESKKGEGPKKNGRPRKEVDMGMVERLAQIMCTEDEIAAVMAIDKSTLRRQPTFDEVYKKGREVGKSSLRRTQWRIAQNNAAMAIWLGKQYLGQTDKVEAVGVQPVTVVSDVDPSR